MLKWQTVIKAFYRHDACALDVCVRPRWRWTSAPWRKTSENWSLRLWSLRRSWRVRWRRWGRMSRTSRAPLWVRKADRGSPSESCCFVIVLDWWMEQVHGTPLKNNVFDCTHFRKKQMSVWWSCRTWCRVSLTLRRISSRCTTCCRTWRAAWTTLSSSRRRYDQGTGAPRPHLSYKKHESLLLDMSRNMMVILWNKVGKNAPVDGIPPAQGVCRS